MTSQEVDWQRRPSLPPELIVHIASYASPDSLAKLELLSRGGHQLIADADTICWRHHALLSCAAPTRADMRLSAFVSLMKNRCLDKAYWDDVPSWKMAFCRTRALQANWRISQTPKTRLDLVGFEKIDPLQSALPPPKLRSLTSSRLLKVPYASQDSSYVWRARLDTARDANFVITTWHTGGLRVVDADINGQGRVLWELPKWSVRPYAHLEYKEGTACWDGEAGIEVWKRWKCVLGDDGCDEPPNKRGQFVKVAVLPDVPNTRGFMLNDDLHLNISSSDGKSFLYDLTLKEPRLLYSFDIPTGAAGHLEHDSDIAVYSLGQKGYTIYEKKSGTHLGDLDFSLQSGTLSQALQDAKETNYFKVDSEEKYWQLAAANVEGKGGHSQLMPPRKEFVITELEAGSLDKESNVIEMLPYDLAVSEEQQKTQKRTSKIRLQDDLWGAAMIRKLQDGATLLVARSRGGRVLVCSNLLGLLASLQQGNEEEANTVIRQSLAIIECGGRASRTEFYTGGWLSLHAGRAAWEIDDLVYLMPMPRKQNTLPRRKTKLWMIPSFYHDEIPVPSLNIP